MHPESRTEHLVVAAFLGSLFLIATIVVVGYFTISSHFDHSSDYGTTINLAGRQRMLSQRLALTLLHLAAEDKPAEQMQLREQLGLLDREMERVHRGMLDGDPELNLVPVFTPEVHGLYDRLTPHLLELQFAVREYLQTDPERQRELLSDHAWVDRMLVSAEAFLKQMDRIVSRLEDDSRRHFDFLTTLYLSGAIGLLVVLGGMTVFLFQPMVRRLRRTNLRLAAANRELEDEIRQRIQGEEERRELTTAIEQAEESIIITSADGSIEYVNPAFERTSGYRAAEALGRKPSLVKSGEHGESHYREMWNTIAQGHVWRGKLINRRKDGRLFTEQVSISPVRDPKGSIVKYIAVKRDITHESHLEAQLQRVQKLEAIGSLAGGIAHEFNNILTPILGYLDLLEERLARKDKGREYIERMRKGSHRARDLVGQILVFSRGTGPGEMEMVHLDRVVKDVLQLVQATLPRNIDVRFDAVETVPPMLGDLTRLHTMLMNLIVNASQAMPDGGRLTLGLEPAGADTIATLGRELGGAWACLSVADTGMGMTQQVKDRIYDPFFTTKEVGQGTGLGLSMVYGIVQEHRGAITVDSTPGQGTVFRVYLPLGEETGLLEDIPGPLGEMRDMFHGDASVLLVDDEEDVLELMREILERMGLRVVTASCGQEALGLWNNGSAGFDMVMTDYVMPGMDGKTLAERLRAGQRNLPIVVMTGRYDLAAQDQELGQGLFDDVLRKPFTYADVERIMLSLLTEHEDPWEHAGYLC